MSVVFTGTNLTGPALDFPNVLQQTVDGLLLLQVVGSITLLRPNSSPELQEALQVGWPATYPTPYMTFLQS